MTNRRLAVTPVIRLFEWFENKVITSSHAVITICPALEEQVRQVSGQVPHVLIENVANSEDPNTVSEDRVSSFKKAYTLDGMRIVLYAGTFEPYQGIDLLITSAERVLRSRKDVLFLLMGGNSGQVHQYLQKVEEVGLTSFFCFTGSRPPEGVPTAIKACHVLVSPRVSGTNTPLKIYSYLQSGKPIVATKLYTHIQVLTPEVAILADPNPEAFAEGILSVLEDSDFALGLGKRARQYFEKCFSMRSYMDKTRQALDLAVG